MVLGGGHKEGKNREEEKKEEVDQYFFLYSKIFCPPFPPCMCTSSHNVTLFAITLVANISNLNSLTPAFFFSLCQIITKSTLPHLGRISFLGVFAIKKTFGCCPTYRHLNE